MNSIRLELDVEELAVKGIAAAIWDWQERNLGRCVTLNAKKAVVEVVSAESIDEELIVDSLDYTALVRKKYVAIEYIACRNESLPNNKIYITITKSK